MQPASLKAGGNTSKQNLITCDITGELQKQISSTGPVVNFDLMKKMEGHYH